jgi:transcriptional regulator with PAS, ATPase and Fis domain
MSIRYTVYTSNVHVLEFTLVAHACSSRACTLCNTQQYAPAVRKAAALVTASTAAAALTTTTVATLLQVAEDNKINQRVLKKMLQDNCSELTVVSDGQQAVDAFHKVHTIHVLHCTAITDRHAMRAIRESSTALHTVQTQRTATTWLTVATTLQYSSA